MAYAGVTRPALLPCDGRTPPGAHLVEDGMQALQHVGAQARVGLHDLAHKEDHVQRRGWGKGAETQSVCGSIRLSAHWDSLRCGRYLGPEFTRPSYPPALPSSKRLRALLLLPQRSRYCCCPQGCPPSPVLASPRKSMSTCTTLPATSGNFTAQLRRHSKRGVGRRDTEAGECSAFRDGACGWLAHSARAYHHGTHGRECPKAP